jgi:hypothetical protein
VDVQKIVEQGTVSQEKNQEKSQNDGRLMDHVKTKEATSTFPHYLMTVLEQMPNFG